MWPLLLWGAYFLTLTHSRVCVCVCRRVVRRTGLLNKLLLKSEWLKHSIRSMLITENGDFCDVLIAVEAAVFAESARIAIGHEKY